MKLLSLDLDHWCQHTTLHVDFPNDPIVRIDGPNDFGKTNMIRAIGRVLAQGRSEFGDSNAIQYGAKQANIRLRAMTSEGIPFACTRTVRERTSKAVLEFGEGEPITESEKIEEQLTAWFGRQDTLLSLFIAPQGKIASLLKEKGKNRLVQFIEICGFRGFLTKQETLNKFIRGYALLADPSAMRLDVEGRITSINTDISTKSAQIDTFQPLEQLRARVGELEAEKLLRSQQAAALSTKRTELAQKEQTVTDPLPDLQQLEAELARIEQERKEFQVCHKHQQVEKLRGNIALLEQQIAKLPSDATDYPKLIQEIGAELQKDFLARNAITAREQSLTEAQRKAAEIQQEVDSANRRIQALTYSTIWHSRTKQELQGLLSLVHQRNALQANLDRTRNRIKQLQDTPQPTQAMLKACLASEEKLHDLVQLKKHATGAHDACPLCKQPWLAEAIQARIRELEAQIAEQQGSIAQATQAQKVYQAWLQAQRDLTKATETLQSEQTSLDSIQQVLSTKLAEWGLPEGEVCQLQSIVSDYAEIHEALNPPTQQLREQQQAVLTATQEVSAAQPEKEAINRRIEGANQRMREVLQAQSAAQASLTEKATLQQQIKSLELAIAAISKGLEPVPASYDNTVDYGALLAQAEEKLTQGRQGFRKASQDWANRYEALKNIAALRNEIAALEHILTTQPWNEEKQTTLTDIGSRLQTLQQLTAEVSLLKTQVGKLKTQLEQLVRQQAEFDKQQADIADLQAVSSFLSYDNGPQKFLEVFFEDALSQTNLLLSEMGLPVTLHMGADLEILVRNRKNWSSASQSLGGGYANLIGIAFRIALQKMVLPRVNTVILDEPSTHVDERNIELLIPFFERLQQRLASYGIAQIIVIDHHPAWRNSSVGLIRLGKDAEDL